MIASIIIFAVIIIVFIFIKYPQKQSPRYIVDTRVQLDDAIVKRHKRTEIRSARLDRHRRIWAVLFYINSHNTLEERLKTDYPTKRMLKEVEDSKNALFEYKPNAEDILTAIRFCKVEYARGKCVHKMIESDIQSIINIYTYAKLTPKHPQITPKTR